MAYLKPTPRVYQDLPASPTTVTPDLNLVLVGPQYSFLEYSDANDKQEAFLGTYAVSGNTALPYPSREPGAVVDQDSVKVYLDDVYAKLATFSDGTVDEFEPDILVSANDLNFTDYVDKSGNSYPISTALHNRGVKIGDLVRVSDGNTTEEARVIGFQHKKSAAAFGSPTIPTGTANHHQVQETLAPSGPSAKTLVSGFSTAPVDFVGIYDFIGGSATYDVEVLETSGGATTGDTGTPVLFEVTNSVGDVPATQQITVVSGVTHYALGTRGLYLVIDPTDNTYEVGDVARVTAVGVATGRGKITVGGAYTGTTDLTYTITVLTGGGSGTAQIVVETPSNVDNSGPHTVTDNTAISIGSRGLTVTFKLPATGDKLVAGDTWTVDAYANGHGAVVTTGTTSQTVTLDTDTGYLGTKEAYIEVEHFASKQTVAATSVTGTTTVVLYAESGGTVSATDTFAVKYTTANGWEYKLNAGSWTSFTNNPVEATYTEIVAGVWGRFDTLSGKANNDEWTVSSIALAVATVDLQWFKAKVWSSDTSARKFALETTEDLRPTSSATLSYSLGLGFDVTFTNASSTAGAVHKFPHYGDLGAKQAESGTVHDMVADTPITVDLEPYADEANWAATTESKETVAGLSFTGGASAANTSVRIINSIVPASATYYMRYNSATWESSTDGVTWHTMSATPTDNTEVSLANGSSITHNGVLVTISSVAAWTDPSTCTITAYKYSDVMPSFGGKYRSHLDDATQYRVSVSQGGALGTAVLNVTTTGTDTVGSFDTIAGVTEYPIGTRGLTLVLPADGLPSANADKIFMRATVTAKPMMSVAADYKFSSNLLYSISVSTAGTISSGTMVLSYTTPHGVDDGTVTINNGATNGGAGYKIGTRGLKINLLDTSTPSNFSGLTGWYINTALDSKYVGTTSQTYTITVTKGGALGTAEVTATSSKGDFSGPTKVYEDTNPYYDGKSAPVQIGNQGLYVRFANVYSNLSGLVEGDTYTVTATPEGLLGKTKLTLSKSLSSSLHQTGLTYSLWMRMDDVLVPETREDGLGVSYTVDTTTITLGNGLTVTDPTVYDVVAGVVTPVYMEVKAGANVYVTYDSLVTTQATQLLTLQGVDDAESQLGRLVPKNPLGYAALKAFANTTTPIKIVRVATNDEAGYLDVLDKLENREDAYALVPLTKDSTIQQAFAQHVAQMSTPDLGRWRVAILNAKLEDFDYLYKSKINTYTQAEEDYEATFVDDPDSADLSPPQYTKMVDSTGEFLADGILPGDKVFTNFNTVDGVTTYDEYVIDRVVNDTTLILATGPLAPVTTAQKYQIVRPLDKTAQATKIGTIAESYGSRRAYYVWPDFVGDGDYTVDGFYLCAAIGGMVAGFPPHQGFTNFAIAGFDDVSRSSTYFSRNQLDIMAEGGTYIVTQDAAGAVPYARHQLSTDMTSIETRELSITKNLDYISYFFKNLLKPYIGVYNVTDETLDILRTVTLGGVSFLRTQSFERIGAPLIDANILRLERNADLRDTVDIDLDVSLPYPLNYINLRLIV